MENVTCNARFRDTSVIDCTLKTLNFNAFGFSYIVLKKDLKNIYKIFFCLVGL